MVEVVALADEIAGVEDEANVAIGVERLPDDAAGIGQDAVLDIAEIQEAKGFGFGRRGAELIPFAPSRRALHAVGIDGVGRQPGEAQLVIERRSVAAVDPHRGAGHETGLFLERRPVDRHRDLGLGLGLCGVGAIGDRHLARRIGAGREDDAVGQVARRIGQAGGTGQRAAGGGRRRHSGDGADRGERDRQDPAIAAAPRSRRHGLAPLRNWP